jgi:zinc protease
MKYFCFLALTLFPLLAPAKASFLDSVKRTKWGDMDVVWVEDDRFPKFTASIYIKDGAFSDSVPGETQATMDLLTSGTSKESQRQIAEYFEFYGAKIRNSVTHEYSVLSVQGLSRDIKPIIGKFCEVYRDAQFPQNELKSYVARAKSGLRNLITSHSSLADRVFRKLTLEGTPYANPVEGTLASFDKITSQMLKARLTKISNAKKVLYLAGPKDVNDMKDAISKCGWKSEYQLPEVSLRKPQSQMYLYLIPVPGANQAQIRLGRYLTKSEVEGKHDQYLFLSSFLGGSFTSKLVQELRVKRGLTYSAGAYASMQRDYGRAGIITFSKTETAADAISIIRDVFNDVSNKRFSDEEFKHQQGHQIGAYAFGFEEMSAFIGQLMLYEHQGRSIEDLARFPEIIGHLKPSNLAETNSVTFQWERMTIVVVGDKSLEKSLSRIRPVKVLDYKDFL